MIRGNICYIADIPRGTKSYKGGKICLIANLPTGEVLLYSICSVGKICYIANIPGECLLYRKTSGGGEFCKGKVYYIPGAQFLEFTYLACSTCEEPVHKS